MAYTELLPNVVSNGGVDYRNAMDLSPLETLQSFITQLLQRHREIRQHEDEDLSLVYADALLRHAVVRPHLDNFPHQVVVIGPTQAGKSTAANLLLGAESAKASALAGFTRHAQGFVSEMDINLSAGTDALLAGLERVDCATLNADQLDQYCLNEAPQSDPFNVSAVIWDTPDFDSVSSRTYRSTVPMLSAIADLIVLVVSKDKYADQTVWESLRLIGQINRPLLVCVNKIPPDSNDQFVQILNEKFKEENIQFGKIVTLPYFSNTEHSDLLNTPSSELLRKECATLIENSSGIETEHSILKQYLDTHWESWLQPLKKEQVAQQHWETVLETTINEGIEQYNQDYLRNPHYSDTLQKAINGLLDLLEIPALAKSLGRARQVITWPARTLTGFIKKQRPAPGEAVKLDNETQVLRDAINHIFLNVQREAGEQAALVDDETRVWWQHLWQALEDEKQSLQDNFNTSIEIHQQAFEPDIKAATEHLYQHLQAHPAKLAALRATRVSADAAAVLFALKTGGIGLNDLILAPAMLSFTNMLTEGAIGQYMKSVEEQLKKKQMTSVKLHIFSTLQNAFQRMPAQMKSDNLYALSFEEMAQAETAISELS